jgi:hypothetical protein
MKKYIPNPHFLLVSFFVLIIMSLGSSLKAQEEKEIKTTIFINDNDTIINGKSLSEVNKEEQTRLRKDFKELEKDIKRGGNEEILITRGGKVKARSPIIRKYGEKPELLPHNKWFDFRFNMPDLPGDTHLFKFDGDSLIVRWHSDTLSNYFHLDSLGNNLRKRIMSMHHEMRPGELGTHEWILPRIYSDMDELPDFKEKNSLFYNYNYTDKDGISNKINILISEAWKNQAKKISGNETIANPLDVSDITVFPNFSSGKLRLSFNLGSRGTTKVRIADSDFKVVFSDDAANFSGNYTRQIFLPRNGLYYISVTQNGKWFVRKLIKE